MGRWSIHVASEVSINVSVVFRLAGIRFNVVQFLGAEHAHWSSSASNEYANVSVGDDELFGKILEVDRKAVRVGNARIWPKMDNVAAITHEPILSPSMLTCQFGIG